MSYLLRNRTDEIFAPAGRPAVRHNHVNGKTTFRWHVDNNDDRYVEVTDRVHDDSVVVSTVDREEATIVVLHDLATISKRISAVLSVLAESSRRERG